MQVGQKVVYIQRDLPGLGLIKNEIYTILSVAECGGCKDGLHIHVGIKIPVADLGIVQCEICKNMVSIGDEYFLHHSGFRLVNESLVETEEFSMILKH